MCVTGYSRWTSWQSGLLEVEIQLFGISSLSAGEDGKDDTTKEEAVATVFAKLFDVDDDAVEITDVATTRPTAIPTAKPTARPSAPTSPTRMPTNHPTRSLESYAEPGYVLACGATEQVTGDTSFRASIGGTNNNRAGDMVYALRAPASGSEVALSTCGSAFDTYLRVFNAKTLELVAENDDARQCSASGTERSVHSYIELPASVLEAGANYWVVVEGYASYEGRFVLTLECPTPAPTPPPTLAPTAATAPTEAPTAAPSASPTAAPSYASVRCGDTLAGSTANMPNTSPGWDPSARPNESGEHIFIFVAPASGTAIFDGCSLGTTFDTIFWLVDPQLAGRNDYAPATVDDSPECLARDRRALRSSYLHVSNMVPGHEYRFVVEGYQDAEGTFDIVVSCPSRRHRRRRRRRQLLGDDDSRGLQTTSDTAARVVPSVAHNSWSYVTFHLDVEEAPGKFQDPKTDFASEASNIIGAAVRSGGLLASLRAAGVAVSAIGTWSVRDIVRPRKDVSSTWIAAISLTIVLPLILLIGWAELKRRWDRWRATRRARVYVDQGQQEQGVVPEADVPEAHEEPPQVETFAREMQLEQIEEGGECSICFDELDADDAERGIIQLFCGHIFHRDCVLAWLIENPTCPLCRRTQDHHLRRHVAALEQNGAVPMLQRRDMPSQCGKWLAWWRKPENCLSSFTLLILVSMVVFVVAWSFSVLLE